MRIKTVLLALFVLALALILSQYGGIGNAREGFKYIMANKSLEENLKIYGYIFLFVIIFGAFAYIFAYMYDKMKAHAK